LVVRTENSNEPWVLNLRTAPELEITQDLLILKKERRIL